MSISYSQMFQTTAEQLIIRFSKPECKGLLIEAWIFADAETRRNIELNLLNAGIKSKIRSLINHFCTLCSRT